MKHTRTIDRPQPLVALTVVAMTLSLLLGCQGKAEQAAAEPERRLVQATEIKQGPDEESIEATGVGAFRDEARLSFKVGGVLKMLTVREGERVKKGQKLAELDLQEVGAALVQAQAGYDKAQRDLQRGQQLRAQEVITQVQLENLETAAKVAKAQLSQAQFSNTTAAIHAPTDGLILRRSAQISEVVAPGQPILLMGSESSGYVVKASLSDKQAVRVSMNQEAEVRFDALPQQQFKGRVIERGQAADPVTGTYSLQVEVKGQTGQTLLSGLTGRIKLLPTSQVTQRAYVPLSAVVEGNSEQAWLFVLQPDNSVKKQSVQVAFVKQDQLALKTPLPEGTRVISAGAAYLRDGEIVKLDEARP